MERHRSHQSGPNHAVFWRHTLPNLAIESLLTDVVRYTGFLVVGEVQDVPNPTYLDALDLLIAGSPRAGRIVMFGDFENQSLYEADDNRSLLRERTPDLVSQRLIAN